MPTGELNYRYQWKTGMTIWLDGELYNAWSFHLENEKFTISSWFLTLKN